MSNIGTTIGAIVGVFIALLVGLSLFGEVADQTAELGQSGDPLVTESYDGGIDTAYDLELVNGATCTYSAGIKPFVRVAVNSSGGVATISAYQVPGTVQCAGLNGEYDARLVLQDGSSDPIGEGAIVTVTIDFGTWFNTPAATVKEPGRARVISGGDGANLSSFIALSTILGILPTVVLVGLLSAGGVLGGFIGRSAGGRFA